MRDLTSVFAAIDQANSHDPNTIDAGPLALVQGRLATDWLARLVSDASPALQVAVRAHHLRRWEISRAEYPEGRAGYLRWRRDNKAHQADAAASILRDEQWNDTEIERVRELLSRSGLRSDPATQALEDAACLVFLTTQFPDMVARTEHTRMVGIVAKTLKKMTDRAIELALALPVAEGERSVISDATASLVAESS